MGLDPVGPWLDMVKKSGSYSKRNGEPLDHSVPRRDQIHLGF